jgi:hypothetical protein
MAWPRAYIKHQKRQRHAGKAVHNAIKRGDLIRPAKKTDTAPPLMR